MAHIILNNQCIKNDNLCKLRVLLHVTIIFVRSPS